MNASDLFSFGAVVAAANLMLGFWANSRIEGSIKHEYDKALEMVKSEWKRTDVLLAERLAVFKLLQKKLVSIRRYSEAQRNSGSGNDFAVQPENLEAVDNISILMHWTELETLLDENLIFLSSSCNAAFEQLRNQLSLGANMEVWLASDAAQEVVSSKASGYQAISNRISECIDALFKDLEFPSKT